MTNPSNGIPEEPEDYKRLLFAIIRQASDDYIKLQHPKFRNKKYLQEAFSSAVELFFDPSYRLLHLKDNFDDDLSLKDLVSHLMDDDRSDLQLLQKHLIQQADQFWNQKYMRTIEIPENFIYAGHVYSVYHFRKKKPEVDFQKKEIYINKKIPSSEKDFLSIALLVVSKHEDMDKELLPMKNKLSESLFKMLKVNSCFTGH